MDHRLHATRDTVHFGGFSPDLPPALTVASGDRIWVETFTGVPVYKEAPPEFLPPAFLDICENLPPERHTGAGPHLLTGPIYLSEAQPGDVLEIRLEQIEPILPVGYTLIRPGTGALPEIFTDRALRFIEVDEKTQTIEFPAGSGIRLPLQPFFGIFGVADQERDRNSIPPGDYGGNLDNRWLQPPCRLFLPVYLPGAMLSVGDGHGLQGDGEACLTALEISMAGVIQLHRRQDLSDLPIPLAETETAWLTMGFGETLDAAFDLALKRMLTFLEMALGISAEEAYMLCSLGVHFNITQVVNRPGKGVHGILPKSILPRAIQI
ncbi:acetamidase [filamentous cyanobacterium CCP5]|nr:acetamidase [filamentous cyanobacterium CCP5]